jgi:hypothetical protein
MCLTEQSQVQPVSSKVSGVMVLLILIDCECHLAANVTPLLSTNVRTRVPADGCCCCCCVLSARLPTHRSGSSCAMESRLGMFVDKP